MDSWKIGKVIVLTWKNRFLEMIKDYPLLAIVPLLIIFGAGFGMYRLYGLVEDQLFAGGANLDLGRTYEYTSNYAQFSYFLALFGVVTLWQWGVRGKAGKRLLETLPVRKSTWTIGQLLPVLLIMWLFALLGLMPMLLVLANNLQFPVYEKIGVILLYFLLIGHSILAALLWQQLIHLLTKRWAGRGSETHHLALHQILFFLSAILAGGLFYFSAQQEWGLDSLLPGALFGETVRKLHEGSSGAFLFAAMLVCSSMILCAAILLLFRFESEWRPDETEGSLPLRFLPFSRNRILSLIITEGKRLSRDYETQFYCALAFVVLAGLGLGLRKYNLLVYGPVYEAVISYGLPFVFCLFSLLSRGRDQGLWPYLNASGIRKWEYAVSKAAVHLVLLPLVTFGLYRLCLFLTGISPSTGTFFLNAQILFLTAYLIGTVLPMNRSNPGSQLMNMLLFYFAAGAVSLAGMLGQPYEPFPGAYAGLYLAAGLMLLIPLETKGVKR
ncbi:hypothetical protein GKZ89_14675 [Bacillus mangrovi]|uniref:Uncharacterized protein n=1 Tax=Metabacillus mangrovi TaxID=1491830 RepID=A0A7X2V5X3_9BACI|nr:hypothetical protein [Metabacillus mangrovi]MTH54646.1 hypothetical protein [Metabacillus mangrovi]